MRLKKILLILVLFLVSFNGKCFKKIFSGGSSSNSCSSTCVVGERYSIMYLDGCSRDLQGQPCPAGFLNFPRDCNGGCNVRIVRERSFGFFFTIDPSGADLNNLPSSVTVSGQGIDATYGPPRVDYYNGDGFFVGTAYATSVANDGSWLVASLPDLSEAYSGTFTLQIVNKNADGDYVDFLGSGTVNCWGRNRPDSDGDGWYDDEDCYSFDPTRWYCQSGGEGEGEGGCVNQVCPVLEGEY